MRKLLFGLFAVWPAVIVATVRPASAEIERVVVSDSGQLGTFGGRAYSWVAAEHGTVPRGDGTTGRYRVPITLIYPDRDANGFGFVDVVNNADSPASPMRMLRSANEASATRDSTFSAISFAPRVSPTFRSNGPAWSPSC